MQPSSYSTIIIKRLINIFNILWITKANAPFCFILCDFFLSFYIGDDCLRKSPFPWLLWHYALVFSFYLFIYFFSGFSSLNDFLNVRVSQNSDTWHLHLSKLITFLGFSNNLRMNDAWLHILAKKSLLRIQFILPNSLWLHPIGRSITSLNLTCLKWYLQFPQ